MVEEARLEDVGSGLAPASDGWFVVNVRDAAWVENDLFGVRCALVLAGECLLLIEGEERTLKAGDFVHCPPGTDHVFVGAGDGPCVVFMVGCRTREWHIVYPRSELALSRGAGVETETEAPQEAYEPFPRWRVERPQCWDASWP